MSTALSNFNLRSVFALRYRRCIEQRILIVAFLTGLYVLAGFQMEHFHFDASSDSLIARGDLEFDFFEKTSERFQQTPKYREYSLENP